MKTIKNAILTLIFALCCCFTFFSISYIGIKVNATEGENQDVIEENENVEEEITEEELVEDVKEVADEFETLFVYIISALGALGVSAGSIATVINWIKKRLKQANNEVVETSKKLEEAKNRISELTEIVEKQLEENDELRNCLSDIKTLLQEFFNCEKEKTEAIKKAVTQVLPNEKEDELNESI